MFAQLWLQPPLFIAHSFISMHGKRQQYKHQLLKLQLNRFHCLYLDELFSILYLQKGARSFPSGWTNNCWCMDFQLRDPIWWPWSLWTARGSDVHLCRASNKSSHRFIPLQIGILSSGIWPLGQCFAKNVGSEKGALDGDEAYLSPQFLMPVAAYVRNSFASPILVYYIPGQ